MVVLIAGVAGAILLGSLEWWLGVAAGFVLAHFYLFCNVFRLSRSLELIWAGIFVTLATTTVLWDTPGWWPTLGASLCVTVLVVALEMRKPSYHGIGWHWINPGLRAWWETHVAKPATHARGTMASQSQRS